MDKAILVMDMPESCDNCPLFGNHYSDLCCKGLNNRSINYPCPKDFKQEWCPLKPIPEKRMYYVFNDCDNAFMDGWNECVDEILK